MISKYFSKKERERTRSQALSLRQASFGLLAFLLVLALLICNTAAGLAGRLARGLAFAAAAVLRALAKVAGFESLNVLHRILPPFFNVFFQ